MPRPTSNRPLARRTGRGAGRCRRWGDAAAARIGFSRCVLAAVLFSSVIGCSEPPRPLSASERAWREIAAISAEPRLRDVCGDAHEAELRLLVAELPPCAPAVTVSYVIAAAAEGTLLTIAAVDARPSAWDAPAERSVVRLLEGRAIARGAPVSTGAVGVAPLLVAALLAEHGEPRIALDEGAIPTIAGSELAGALALAPPTVLGVTSTRAVAIGYTGETGADQFEERLVRLEATLGERGTVVVTSSLLVRREVGSLTVPGLRLGSADEPLPRTNGPRPLCGDPYEAALRAVLVELPGCVQSFEAVYAAASTVEGPLAVVAWLYQRPHMRSRTWPQASVRVIHGERILEHFPSVATAASEDDRVPLLVAAILARVGSPRVAFERSALPADLSAAARTALRPIPLGVERGPDGSVIAMRAVGYAGQYGVEGTVRPLSEVRAALGDRGHVEITLRMLLRERLRDDTWLVWDETAADPGDPLAGLEGL